MSVKNPSRVLLGVVLAGALAAALLLALSQRNTVAAPHVVGNVRVTALTDRLVRFEERGVNGFEDRQTFHVVERAWTGVPLTRVDTATSTTLSGPGFSVQLPALAPSLDGVKLLGPNGETLHQFTTAVERAVDLPSPSRLPAVWLMADVPRIVPPPWGATPPPRDGALPATSGWDITNPARDVYAFLPVGDHARFRAEFLRLTGPIPIPPLYTFGLWTSRWHPYTEQTALEEMDQFRKRGFPLDLFVVDTDWRVGASDGYGVNTNNFPDMKRFVDAAHARNVRLLFNDHPEPMGKALDPLELKFRWDGLTSLLALGADAWWYDRNWHTTLPQPAPGLRKEVWGMRLYQDITQRFRPNVRPLIMSNVDGIRSGQKVAPSDPAAHRFPIWWTGDTYADWPFLQMAVKNSVDEGILSATPYVNDDCGGHYFKATPELYTRFMQFCALSPVLRPHASQNLSRLPWEFDAEAEDLVRRAVLLRYRLMPMLYAAARRAFEDGMPLLRRLDLEWPEPPEAADATQYLLGDDLLVAPILDGLERYDTLPEDTVAFDGKPGVKVELRRGSLQGEMLAQGQAPTIAYRGWPVRAEVPEGVVGSWRTTWTVAEDGVWGVRLISDGMGKVWMDDQLVVDDTVAINDIPGSTALKKGQQVSLRVELGPTQRVVTGILLVAPPSSRQSVSSRSVWIPPGEWEDLWTGQRHQGPVKVTVSAPRAVTPMFARVGGVVITTAEMKFTGEAPWDPVVLDVFVSATPSRQTRVLYEDDGNTNGYLTGAFRKTTVTLEDGPDGARLVASAAQGSFPNATEQRKWVVRFHLPPGSPAGALRVNGKECVGASANCRVIAAQKEPLPTLFSTQGAAAPQAGPVLEAAVGPLAPHKDLTVEWTAPR